VAEAIAVSGALTAGPVLAGGHSYGGRLTSMVAASQPGPLAALTLFSYPLHPPGKPERLRMDHFPAITVPTVFTHGSSDPFGSLSELRAATALIPGPTAIVEVSGARHDLAVHKGAKVLDVPAMAVEAALRIGSWS
jgi:predicted alpha/beta-hydrolase family hydrolase